MVSQPSLFGFDEPRFDPGLVGLKRRALSATAWVDHLPGWLKGHEHVYTRLRQSTRWHHQQREMYERIVDVPRLTAGLPDDGPGHPIVEPIATALSHRYEVEMLHIGLARYRDGRDSVAWHGDQIARHLPQALVATVSVGAPRKFMIRPKGGGPSLTYALGWGDLIVMGGSCQRDFQHCVPKVSRAGERITIMFRPDWV